MMNIVSISSVIDSSIPHGMIAVGGEDCEFYAIVLNPTGASIPELDPMRYTPVAREMKSKTERPGIWQKWIDI